MPQLPSRSAEVTSTKDAWRSGWSCGGTPATAPTAEEARRPRWVRWVGAADDLYEARCRRLLRAWGPAREAEPRHSNTSTEGHKCTYKEESSKAEVALGNANRRQLTGSSGRKAGPGRDPGTRARRSSGCVFDVGGPRGDKSRSNDQGLRGPGRAQKELGIHLHHTLETGEGADREAGPCGSGRAATRSSSSASGFLFTDRGHP